MRSGREGHETVEDVINAFNVLGVGAFSKLYNSPALLGIGKLVNIVEGESSGGRTRVVNILTEAAIAQQAADPRARAFEIERSGNTDIFWFIPFSTKPLKLGRNSSNDVVIVEHSISSTHCYFHWDGRNTLKIIDSQSSNGVWVHGKKLERHRPFVLQGGEHILLGRFQFLFLYPEGLYKFLGVIAGTPEE